MKAIPLKKKKQTKGKGGAWRALVRMETQGVSQPSNLKQVAVAYRKIKQEDGQRYRELLRLGRLATMSGKKCSDAKRTSFGLRYKQFVHAKKHLHIQHLAAQIQGLTADGRARHMLQYVRDQDATPDEAMKLCKAIERHWGKMKIQKEVQQKAMVEEFGKDNEKLKEVFQQCMPDANPADFVAIPSPFSVCFQAKLESSMQSAVQTCAWACDHKSSELSMALQTEWQQWHKVIFHDECPLVRRNRTLGLFALKLGFASAVEMASYYTNSEQEPRIT